MKRTSLRITVIALAVIVSTGVTLAQAQKCYLPGGQVNLAPTADADVNQGVILTTFVGGSTVQVLLATQSLTDLTHKFSYCPTNPFVFTRVIPGTNEFMGFSTNQVAQTLNIGTGNTVSTVASITVAQINQQLKDKGLHLSLDDVNHESVTIPGGLTALISHNEKIVACSEYPTQCTGYAAHQTDVDILGDAVIVLDSSGNAVWVWDAFTCPNCSTMLPVNRAAILGELCVKMQDSRACPLQLAPIANDWLHSNSINYDPSDGNLVVSIRSQDWVIKLAYQDGQGDGHIVWRLGKEGDFTMLNTPGIQFPWFSHQHDAQVWREAPMPGTLSLFDNGNTRKALLDPLATSRGQVLVINEAPTVMTADILFNAVLPTYSDAYGTAQLLNNGNWWFWGGHILYKGQHVSQGFEYTPAEQLVYRVTYNRASYRSNRFTTIAPFMPSPQ
jgi:hypothetical protein